MFQNALSLKNRLSSRTRVASFMFQNAFYAVPGRPENGPNRSSVSRRPKVLRFDKGRVRKSFTFRSLPEPRNFVSRTGPGSATFSAPPFVDICTTSAVKLHVMVSGMHIASIYLPRCSCAQNCNFPLFLHAAKAFEMPPEVSRG